MSTKNNGCCRRIRTALRLFTRPDALKMNPDLFRASFPTERPTDKDDIIDIIIQIIIMLMEYFKPDDDDDDDNDETAFPKLRFEARDLARTYVPATTLFNTAAALAGTITTTVEMLRTDPPETLRQAREAIRLANHQILISAARDWATWNIEIRAVLDNYADNDMLNTLSSYLDAWTQIAKGLKLIK